MNAGIIGADPQALRDMAAKFDTSADQLDGVKGSVQSWVDRGDIWRGLDNQRFVTNWNSVGSSAVTNVAAQLRRAADLLRLNADEQDTASSTGGSISPGSGLFSGDSSSTDLGQKIYEGTLAVLQGVGGVLRWIDDALDSEFGGTRFRALSGLVSGLTAGWQISDDLYNNDGQRFFEITSGAALGLVGGMVGGTMGIPGGPVGIAGGAVGGAIVLGAVGSEIGAVMDHSLRGEGAQYINQRVDDLVDFGKDVAGVAGPALKKAAEVIVKTPVSLPFAL